jgi:hypothetical protein
MVNWLLQEHAEEFKNKQKPNAVIAAIRYALYSCGAQPVFAVTHRPAQCLRDFVDQHV